MYESSLLCEGIINDTIYYVQPIKGILGYEYQKMHACPVNPRLHSDQQYTYHLKMFADSLANHQYLSTQYLRAVNAERYAKHSEEVGAKVPNGYVDSWGFDIQEELLMFDFSYTNTNKKGIRHIDVFFNLKDEEGNTRKTGKVRGTGPVEMFETKSWTWSDSNLKVPIGCVDLEITKVAITYKDGKVKTLTKDILYKESE